jgi:hypothetical protein
VLQFFYFFLFFYKLVLNVYASTVIFFTHVVHHCILQLKPGVSSLKNRMRKRKKVRLFTLDGETVIIRSANVCDLFTSLNSTAST